jgi:CheY-like chemotaxis protein
MTISMSLTCLIAAHDPWFIQLIRVYSMECGLNAAEAFVSQDILPVVHQEHPSVILLQADLPGQVRGLELVSSIHKDPVARSIPIIIFHSQAFSVTPELAEMASACIQEPVSFGAFQEALRKAGIPVPGKVEAGLVGVASSADPPASHIKKHPKRKRKPAQ